MKKIIDYLKRLDWILVIIVLLLVGMGLLSNYSSSLYRRDFLIFKKQVIFLMLGIPVMFLFSLIDWRTLREDPYLILVLYFLCLVSLAGLFFFAPKIRGVKSWYRIGGISIDPIEFTKIVIIVLLAKYFSMRHIEMYRIQHIFLSGFYVLLPAILIFLQPNMGSILILIALWMGILIVSGIKIRHFLILLLCGLLIFVLSWNTLLKGYQRERIISFIMPQEEPLGAGWSQSQAKIAIGSGGLFGKGLGHGSQTQYGFLPEPHTDFIFAAIAEETGLIGVGFLFSLFAVLVWRILKIALDSQTNFPRLVALGFAIHLIAQIFINIGMNLGMMPIVGIPLPLISYGGSSLMATFISLGLLESIVIHR